MSAWRTGRTAYDPTSVERQLELRGAVFAGFGRRAAAFALDFGIVCLAQGLAMLPATLRARGGNVNFEMDIDPFHGWWLLSLPLYFGLLTWWGEGRTPGKRLLGIRVVSLAHGRLGLWHSLERALGYGASILEGGFGFLQYFIHPNRQTVHDRIAETIVVRERAPAPSAAPAAISEAAETSAAAPAVATKEEEAPA